MKHVNKQAKRELNDRLRSAFRHGSSAFRFGLMPAGISDHLPIVAKLPFKLLSWNLLAEEHLFNNFRNISGIHLLESALNESLGTPGHVYGNGNMYHLIAEIAQYLLKKTADKSLLVDRGVLEGFATVNAQGSRRARSRDPQVAQERTAQVENARRALVGILLDEESSQAHEYRLSLQHALEMIDHIQSPGGVLRWENRLKKLVQNTAAVFELCSQDILAFQECTSPADLKNLIKKTSGGFKKMKFISHNLSRHGKSTDNVVLAFDTDKYKLLGKPVKTSFEKKKPAVYCLLEDIESGERLIVGSIHHPGGVCDLTHEIRRQVEVLQAGDNAIPYYIAGDFNHTAEDFPIHCPTQAGGSMAGSDYGNTNAYIDGIMSNRDLGDKVKRSACIQLAQPSTQSIEVVFDLAAKKMVVIEPTLKPSVLATSVFAASALQALEVKHDDDDLGRRLPLTIGV